MAATHVASRYNFCVPLKDGALLYNLSSGRLVRFAVGDGKKLARLLGSSTIAYVERVGFAIDTWNLLVDGGFVVPVDFDEVAEIKRRYRKARRDAPVVVTIAVTYDCNLRCFYCYENRRSERLEAADVDRILSRLDTSMEKAQQRTVHVDWYGGEPLLNLEFIEYASPRLREHVAARNFAYSASIISNGTRWPDDPAAFVRRHAIREVQISFDGARGQHNKYRAFHDQRGSSFDEAVRVVDALVSECKVNVRLNLDANSARTVSRFLEFTMARRWFQPPNRGVLQPARLAAFSKRSAFMESSQLSVTDFEGLKAHIRRISAGAVRIEEAETIDGFPRPRTSVCAALASTSFVVGADVREYRCGLQAGEAGRDMGALVRSHRSLSLFRPESHGTDDSAFWAKFDPTRRAKCSRCSFLPVCWGGCPKGHLEDNQHALDEQCRYWRENLARLISAGAGEEQPSQLTYGEDFQIREHTCV